MSDFLSSSSLLIAASASTGSISISVTSSWSLVEADSFSVDGSKDGATRGVDERADMGAGVASSV